MPITQPNTLGIVTQMQSELTALKLSDGVTLAYKTVILGGEKDYTTLAPCCVIVLHEDESARHAHGGTIVEHQGIEIRSVVPYDNAQAAELQIIGIRDALMPLLQKYATLQGTMGVYHAEVKSGSGKFAWMYLKPNWYRIHTVELLVAQYYVIQGGIQN